ncbi:MAG: hypothetical protein JSV82_05925 [Planctomycetota bacterium]|nr:MAG: hypothetical protein JSV82_05925 [Planctomycetota bacterium]
MTEIGNTTRIVIQASIIFTVLMLFGVSSRSVGYTYGSMDSERFKRQCPNGFEPIYEKAKSFGCRLGI